MQNSYEEWPSLFNHLFSIFLLSLFQNPVIDWHRITNPTGFSVNGKKGLLCNDDTNKRKHLNFVSFCFSRFLWCGFIA